MVLSLVLSAIRIALPTVSNSVPAPEPKPFNCQALSNALAGKVISPGSPDYTSSIGS